MSNADRLVKLAGENFTLSPVEEEFFRKVGSGEAFDRSSGDAAVDDPAKSDQWREAAFVLLRMLAFEKRGQVQPAFGRT